LEAMLQKLEDMINSNPNMKEDLKAGLIDMQRRFAPELRSICAVFRVVAEPERAQEYALVESRKLLDVLRYCILCVSETPDRIEVCIQGEGKTARRSLLIHSDPVIASTWSFSGGERFLKFTLSAEVVEELEEYGLSHILAMLGKETPTEMEEILVHGLHWFANSQMELEKEYQLLSLIICLETFLTSGQPNEPISSAIVDGVAFTVLSTQDERLKMKKRIKELYDKRSAISHGRTGVRNKSPITADDIYELTDIASSVIRWLVVRRAEFSSKQQLLTLLEELRFS